MSVGLLCYWLVGHFFLFHLNSTQQALTSIIIILCVGFVSWRWRCFFHCRADSWTGQLRKCAEVFCSHKKGKCFR